MPEATLRYDDAICAMFFFNYAEIVTEGCLRERLEALLLPLVRWRCVSLLLGPLVLRFVVPWSPGVAFRCSLVPWCCVS